AAGSLLVLCYCQAEGDADLSVEQFAVTLDDASVADSVGVAGSAGPIGPDGPVAYRSSLAVDEIVAALRGGGVPAAASRDAGGYLCNHAFYVLMQLLELERPAARGGFVHVPLLQTIPLDQLVRAGRFILETA